MFADESRLDERLETILKAVIDFYMKYAVAAGSDRLRMEYNLAWSSATIRNEMARLEREGYLSHSHTSAGRIPTGTGMRYFVDRLLESDAIPNTVRRRIETEMEGVDSDPVRLMYRVSEILSRHSRNVSLVQAVHRGNWNYVIAGKEYFLGQPEFSDSLKLKDLFHVLEEEEVREEIFRPAAPTGAVNIRIGAEELRGPYQELFEDISVVWSFFGAHGRTMGAVSIIGPQRMNYRQTIPLVDLTAQSMCRRLSQA